MWFVWHRRCQRCQLSAPLVFTLPRSKCNWPPSEGRTQPPTKLRLTRKQTWVLLFVRCSFTDNNGVSTVIKESSLAFSTSFLLSSSSLQWSSLFCAFSLLTIKILFRLWLIFYFLIFDFFLFHFLFHSTTSNTDFNVKG